MYAQSVTGGNLVYSSLWINAPAPAGLEVKLASSNPAVAMVPGAIAFPAGASGLKIRIDTVAVASPTKADITFTCGTVSKTLSITIIPPALAQLDLYAQTAAGGNPVYSSLWLMGPAPSGTSVTAISSNPALAIVPSTIPVPVGATGIKVRIDTTSVAAQAQVAITFTAGGVSKVLAITLVPPSISQLDMYSQTVIGGNVVVSGLWINAPAPADTVVTATSSNPVLAPIAAAIPISIGQTSTLVKIQTSSVVAPTQVAITFAAGGTVRTLNLTLLPH
jgi:hypothetical protein